MSHVVDRCEDLLVILEIGLTVRRHAPPPDKQTTKHHGPNYRTEAEAARWPWQRSYGDLRWWPRQWRRFTVETNSGGNARWRLENGRPPARRPPSFSFGSAVRPTDRPISRPHAFKIMSSPCFWRSSARERFVRAGESGLARAGFGAPARGKGSRARRGRRLL
ncbi:hypothetical protein ACQJBY_022804 [Aegilops geniculata]